MPLRGDVWIVPTQADSHILPEACLSDIVVTELYLFFAQQSSTNSTFIMAEATTASSPAAREKHLEAQIKSADMVRTPQ